MSDRHVRRSADDYTDGLANLLPVGRAWSRDPDSVLMRFIGGLAAVWGDVVDSRAADLLERETDPRFTRDMLADWERAFGLPDPCVAEPLTIADRITALLRRMTEAGGQSREFFYAIATSLGYRIDIFEFAPVMCGVSECGDTRPIDSVEDWGSITDPVTESEDWGSVAEPATEFEDYDVDYDNYRWVIGPEEIRFYWRVKIRDVRWSWFRCGSGECGVDHHLTIALATDLECLFRRYKPAHTEVVIDYSGMSDAGPLAGTP